MVRLVVMNECLFFQVEDKAWGGKNRNGEWNGLMRDILESKADLAMTSLKITTERSEIIDFSMPFMGTVSGVTKLATQVDQNET